MSPLVTLMHGGVHLILTKIATLMADGSQNVSGTAWGFMYQRADSQEHYFQYPVCNNFAEPMTFVLIRKKHRSIWKFVTLFKNIIHLIWTRRDNPGTRETSKYKNTKLKKLCCSLNHSVTIITMFELRFLRVGEKLKTKERLTSPLFSQNRRDVHAWMISETFEWDSSLFLWWLPPQCIQWAMKMEAVLMYAIKEKARRKWWPFQANLIKRISHQRQTVHSSQLFSNLCRPYLHYTH